MSINVRCQMFFTTDDNEGWSEGIYLISTSIASAQTALDAFVPLRAAFLSADASIVYARVSDVAIKGDSLLTTLSLPVLGTYAPAGSSPLEANTAVLLEIFASSILKNRVFFRGLRSDTVVGREFTPPVGFTTPVGAYLTSLMTSGLAVRHRTAIGPPPTYSYTLATSANTVKATARKPGRPFGLPVGRR